MSTVYRTIGEATQEALALSLTKGTAAIRWNGAGYEVQAVDSESPTNRNDCVAVAVTECHHGSRHPLFALPDDVQRAVDALREDYCWKFEPPKQALLDQQQAWDADDALLAAVEDIDRCDRFELKRQAHGGFAIMGDSGYYQSIQHRLVAEMLHALLSGDLTSALQLRTTFIESLPEKP
ncbi:MAG: hypothetical protein AB7G13_28685 [Lautropia sp.]